MFQLSQIRVLSQGLARRSPMFKAVAASVFSLCLIAASFTFNAWRNSRAQVNGQRAGNIVFVNALPATCNPAAGITYGLLPRPITYWICSDLNVLRQIDNTGVTNNPAPTITSLSPNSTAAGGNDFTLTVTGTNFVMSSIVTWDAVNKATTYVNATTLTAQIAAADIASAGTRNVAVFNPAPGGGTSSNATFTVFTNNPVPTITTISPGAQNAGGSGFLLTVNGTNFVNTSVIRWNGSDRITSFISATQLTATILPLDYTSAGTANVTVFNPAPAGGASNTATFIIQPGGVQLYAAPGATATTPCTLATPCDPKFLLGPSSIATPDSTINLRVGVFNDGVALSGNEDEHYVVQISGTNGHPITIQPYAGEQINVQGGFYVGSAYHDLVFDGKMQGILDNQTVFSNAPKPNGMEIRGQRVTVKNWIVVRNGVGIARWGTAAGSNVSDSLIWQNGFDGGFPGYDNRGNGPGLYLQNSSDNGRAYVTNVVSAENASVGGKVYGENSPAEYYTIENSTFFNNGSIAPANAGLLAHNFDISMSNATISSNNNEFLNNVTWTPANVTGGGVRVGWQNFQNNNNKLQGNYIVGGANGGGIEFRYAKQTIFTGNTVIQTATTGGEPLISVLPAQGFTFFSANNNINSNIYWSFDTNRLGLNYNDPIAQFARALSIVVAGRTPWYIETGYDAASQEIDPTGSTKVVLRQLGASNYAFLTIVNFTASSNVAANLTGFVSVGQNWQAWHMQNFVNLPSGSPATLNGTPNQTGIGPSATMTMNGPHGQPFAVFVLKRL